MAEYIYREVEDYIDKCDYCLRNKRGMKVDGRAPMTPIVSEVPWQVIGVDVIGPYILDNGERKCALIVCDYFSKEVVLESVKDQTAESVMMKLVSKVFDEKGVPERIIGDRCKQFLSKWGGYI